jgi:hypothetical protein
MWAKCIIQHSSGDVCHGAEFLMEYANKLIRGDPQGGHSIGQLCGDGRQSWDKHTSYSYQHILFCDGLLLTLLFHITC